MPLVVEQVVHPHLALEGMNDLEIDILLSIPTLKGRRLEGVITFGVDHFLNRFRYRSGRVGTGDNVRIDRIDGVGGWKDGRKDEEQTSGQGRNIKEKGVRRQVDSGQEWTSRLIL